jgi:short-subunit dehydrogenase
MELNFFAPVSLARAAAPTMPPGGQIVVTSSLSGKIGTPAASSYSASKVFRRTVVGRGCAVVEWS